jgi:hypothetical protein
LNRRDNFFHYCFFLRKGRLEGGKRGEGEGEGERKGERIKEKGEGKRGKEKGERGKGKGERGKSGKGYLVLPNHGQYLLSGSRGNYFFGTKIYTN